MNWTCRYCNNLFFGILKIFIFFFLSPYILCNFVPMELQEMYGRNFIQKIISTTVILSNFISVTPLRAYPLFWKFKDLKQPNMNTFHCFELPHKPFNFSPSCPEYPDDALKSINSCIQNSPLQSQKLTYPLLTPVLVS